MVGSALHKAMEGFGIAGPLAGHNTGWGKLLGLGPIAGGPLALGELLGGVWVLPMVELLFLSLLTGSLVFVVRELLQVRSPALNEVSAAIALTAGLFFGFATELLVASAYSRSTHVAVHGKAHGGTHRWTGPNAQFQEVSWLAVQ